MILSLEAQAGLFLLTILLGGALGLLYDCLRVLRYIVPHKRFWIQLEDALYWVLAIFLVFAVMLQANNGEIRFFTVLGMLGGLGLYFLTVSRIVMAISGRVIDAAKRVVLLFFTILFTPFQLLFLLFRAPARKVGYFYEKNSRRVLQRCKSYVKIKKNRIDRDWKMFRQEREKETKGFFYARKRKKKKTR